MAKLTNWNRDGIVSASVEQTFAARLAALKTAEDALGREAYNFLFPEIERRAVSKVPANWFRADECLRFNAGGQRITLSLIGEGLPAPYKAKGASDGGYGCNTLGAIPDGDLCSRIQAHALALEAYRAERRAAERAVKSLVQSVTTVGKLREVWPEGAPFYSKLEASPPPSVPAVRVAEVNALLGLSQAA